MDAARRTGTIQAWRHPRAEGAEGRCIGRTELVVDRRRSKRLARRIQAFAGRQRLRKIVVTSPRCRCADIGRWLARWGWRHRIDAGLDELDFGRWDGLPWSAIPIDEIDAWCKDFENAQPGGGESVNALLARVRAFDAGDAAVIVTHGGWLSAALWLATQGDARPVSDRWPRAPDVAEHIELIRATSATRVPFRFALLALLACDSDSD